MKLKYFAKNIILSVLMICFYGMSCSAMEVQSENKNFDVNCGSDDWSELLKELRSSRCNTIKLEILLSEQSIVAFYQKLLPWISEGNTFIYLAQELTSSTCDAIVYKSRIIAAMTAVRDEWLFEHSDKILPEANAHLPRIGNDEEKWCDEWGNKETGRGRTRTTYSGKRAAGFDEEL